MSSYRIASRYAKSLFDLSLDQNKLDNVLQDMESFANISKQKDMALLLKSPIVKSDKKAAVMKAIFQDKVENITFQFFDILLRKGREAYLPEIAEEFIRQYRDHKHISIVEITSAQPLDDASLQSIKAKLIASKQTQSDIQFKTKVDPELIGGFVISFDDKLYDASIRHQLQSLRKQFAS